MRKHARIAAAVLVGGAAAVAGPALMASNTMPDGGVAGYGQVVSSGATITEVSSTPLSTDASKLDSVVFTSSTDVTGQTATLTLKSGTTVVGSPYSCTLGAFSAGSMTITCDATDNPLLSAYNTTGLTIV